MSAPARGPAHSVGIDGIANEGSGRLWQAPRWRRPCKEAAE